MIYLDYAANCPVDKDILEKYVDDSLKYYMNPNSNHKLGTICKNKIDDASKGIKELLDIKNSEIIYTSGATESNNLVIKGIVEAYDIKHIIISPFEHSSVVAPCQYLQSKNNVKVDFAQLNDTGEIDVENLEKLITTEKTLVSIIAVESETGIIQPIDEISKILKKYNNVIFHSDVTQAVGKIKLNYNNLDLFTFTPHKFFGINGIGVLAKKEEIKLYPIIHGGKSTTKYRSGTPNLPLILSVYNSLEKTLKNLNKNNEFINKIKQKLIAYLSKNDKVKINSTEKSVNNILNISVEGMKSDIISKELEENDIYISTKSACSSDNAVSKAVYALTKDEKIASSTIRISISQYTTEEEIDTFIKIFENILKKI